ncbi:putative transposase [Mesorhizobium alhagi CCNWXJ12-2]|uniref:Putative transposase n=1 Tax=Mesorhizobium alhagi CCNWXJ12-2 TaxID=1107882 RepID=H0HYY4_9HYPH|nr:putative transposase [Mesorhizobium alhagi CCNWXJ12-2]
MEVIDESRLFLTEAQFAKLKPHFPTTRAASPRVDDRRVISGIIHVIKSGGRWIDAPAAYGPRKTLYNRFQRWAAKGVWSGYLPCTLPVRMGRRPSFSSIPQPCGRIVARQGEPIRSLCSIPCRATCDIAAAIAIPVNAIAWFVRATN